MSGEAEPSQSGFGSDVPSDVEDYISGSREGVKGPLTIAAEIFELTPSLVVLEVKKKAGDRAEYEQFCNTELRAGLQNLMIEESAATPYLPSDNAYLPSDTA